MPSPTLTWIQVSPIAWRGKLGRSTAGHVIKKGDLLWAMTKCNSVGEFESLPVAKTAVEDAYDVEQLEVENAKRTAGTRNPAA